MIKPKLLIAVLLMIVTISACKKEETQPGISGKWYVKVNKTYAYRDKLITTQHLYNTFTADDYIQFNADNTGVASQMPFNAAAPVVVNFTYKLNGKTITIDPLVEPYIIANPTITSSTDTGLELHMKTPEIAAGFEQTSHKESDLILSK